MGLPIMNNLALDVLFKAGELVGKFRGDPNRFSFNPENYFRVLSMGLGRFSFSKLLASPHGLKAGGIVFGKALKKFGKINLAPQEFVRHLRKAGAPVITTDDFPLTLITGERTLEAKCTNLRGVKSLIAKQAGNYLRIHPEDAGLYGIEDGGLASVATRNGSVVISARVGPEIRKGVVSIGSGWGRQLFHPQTDHIENQGVNANELTDDDNLDPIVGMPVYNAIPCSVRTFVC